MTYPADKINTFSRAMHSLLREFGWYTSGDGWREASDYDRGSRPGLSAGQVVDELIRRDWALND